MNKKLGLYSSLHVTITVTLFALFMIIGNVTMSFFVSMLLSWGYLLLICSFATEIIAERKSFAFVGIAFACVYVMFISLVYFIQLATVANQTGSAEASRVLSYQTVGSLMFNLTLFGYGMMSFSTFFIGTAIKPTNKIDQWLKVLLILHGLFAPACILLPLLNVFNSSSGEGGNFLGTFALLFWCAYFLPLGILSLFHFKIKVNELY